MIHLSTELINQRASYSVKVSPYGEFRFETEFGIGYSISFEEETSIGGCDTYQFVIKKIEDRKSPHDPKVEQTILAILDIFFKKYLNVMLYLCDDSDGREANRNRLFLNWFKKRAAPERFTIRTASTVIEGKGFYAAIIIENRNPKLQAVIDDFEQTAEALTNGKP